MSVIKINFAVHSPVSLFSHFIYLYKSHRDGNGLTVMQEVGEICEIGLILSSMINCKESTDIIAGFYNY